MNRYYQLLQSNGFSKEEIDEILGYAACGYSLDCAAQKALEQ